MKNKQIEFIDYEGSFYSNMDFSGMGLGQYFAVPLCDINDYLINYIINTAKNQGVELVPIGNMSLSEVFKFLCVGHIINDKNTDNTYNTYKEKVLSIIKSSKNNGLSKTQLRRLMPITYNPKYMDMMVIDGMIEEFYHEGQKSGRKTTYYILPKNDLIEDIDISDDYEVDGFVFNPEITYEEYKRLSFQLASM